MSNDIDTKRQNVSEWKLYSFYEIISPYTNFDYVMQKGLNIRLC